MELTHFAASPHAPALLTPPTHTDGKHSSTPDALLSTGHAQRASAVAAVAAGGMATTVVTAQAAVAPQAAQRAPGLVQLNRFTGPSSTSSRYCSVPQYYLASAVTYLFGFLCICCISAGAAPECCCANAVAESFIRQVRRGRIYNMDPIN
jgi:hypothetical protein